MTWLSDLGAATPVVAAPMAGGPTTPELVVAAADAGSLGFVAGGYLSGAGLGEQLEQVRAQTQLYGVNLFAPYPVPVDRAAYAAYRDLISGEAERYAVELPADPVEDDDAWRDKVDLLLEHPAPVVSFTFGIPGAAALAALRGVGSLLAQTVTSADEARQAAEAGVDVLAVQASAAGGHSGTFTAVAHPRAAPAPRSGARGASGRGAAAAGRRWSRRCRRRPCGARRPARTPWASAPCCCWRTRAAPRRPTAPASPTMLARPR